MKLEQLFWRLTKNYKIYNKSFEVQYSAEIFIKGTFEAINFYGDTFWNFC